MLGVRPRASVSLTRAEPGGDPCARLLHVRAESEARREFHPSDPSAASGPLEPAGEPERESRRILLRRASVREGEGRSEWCRRNDPAPTNREPNQPEPRTMMLLTNLAAAAALLIPTAPEAVTPRTRGVAAADPIDRGFDRRLDATWASAASEARATSASGSRRAAWTSTTSPSKAASWHEVLVERRWRHRLGSLHLRQLRATWSPRTPI